MTTQLNTSNLPFNSGITSFDQWLQQVGVTPTTGWRWRKKGWVETLRICNKLYISQEAANSFLERAKAGEFAQEPKIPKRKGVLK